MNPEQPCPARPHDRPALPRKLRACQPTPRLPRPSPLHFLFWLTDREAVRGGRVSQGNSRARDGSTAASSQPPQTDSSGLVQPQQTPLEPRLPAGGELRTPFQRLPKRGKSHLGALIAPAVVEWWFSQHFSTSLGDWVATVPPICGGVLVIAESERSLRGSVNPLVFLAEASHGPGSGSAHGRMQEERRPLIAERAAAPEGNRSVGSLKATAPVAC